jgi:hypothetical protein
MLMPVWFHIAQVMSVWLSKSKKPIGFVELPGSPGGFVSELSGAQVGSGVVVVVPDIPSQMLIG